MHHAGSQRDNLECVYECDICMEHYIKYDTAVTCEAWHAATGRNSKPPRDAAFLSRETPTKRYMCEHCNSLYDTYQSALDCEVTHGFVSPAQ